MKMKLTTLACALVCSTALSGGASAQDDTTGPAPAGLEITELVQGFARRNHRPIAIDSRARGQVTLAGIDPEAVTYDQLLAILGVNGISVVDSGGVLSVVPDANARQFPTPIYTNIDFKASDHEIVSLLVTPKKVCAHLLVPVLRPLMPQAAHLAAEVQTNTLIINDRADNARRVAAMIAMLDERGSGAEDCRPNEPAKKGRG